MKSDNDRTVAARWRTRVRRVAAVVALVLLTSCGGDSTVTTVTGAGNRGEKVGPVVSTDLPIGPNTTEIVVDSGPPSAFALGVTNIPYVTVTVCAPGSTDRCVTVDHVFLDTGSVGFRVLKSAVANLALPPINAPSNVANATTGGPASECFPFVLGAVWGPLAHADLRIAGEAATSLPIQIIDDSRTPTYAAPNDCVASSNGGLLNSVTVLQANGILGVGMIGYDCGVPCVSGNYAGGYALYYACSPALPGCVPTAMPVDLQIQNPVAHFQVNNNGTVIALPALPSLGASVAKGRLVFGIGTQANNQIPLTAAMYRVDSNPSSPNYLYVSTKLGAKSYANSYIDSGSNAYFFDDQTIPRTCASSAGTVAGWYCPASVLQLSAMISDVSGNTGQVNFSLSNADVLFVTANTAFANLGGSTNLASDSFVWGLPFFFGRSVYTSIWGQVLSSNGPWYAF
jgi:hypothetical protein